MFLLFFLGREIKKRTRKTAATAKEKKKGGGPGNATAIEAIEKIVQEKKISTKINYDVLKNLTLPGSSRFAHSSFDSLIFKRSKFSI